MQDVLDQYEALLNWATVEELKLQQEMKQLDNFSNYLFVNSQDMREDALSILN